ncbi:Sodium-coupled monocarboxylate transporter 1 [Folsomia candida]|uniref:Sodium-coupled monocarboxylate transporter 1 n=1 Tax=Folsomia candida TaxID=158441 RepID=A0A226EYW8_FOLCA|nr:Sodium-coupled monocarboxylate transporter 1 [Folsomia candida]
MEPRKGSFTILDYIIFLGTLAVSMLIGVYYAFIKKQKTNVDLLVGGRSMPIIPTSLSLLATYMSAILVLGVSGEIYANGTLISEIIVGAMFYIPLGGVLFLPTLYRLRLTSAYEYLGMRYQSEAVRLLATGTFIVQIILYMGVVLYAPSLALNAVTDFPIWASIVAVGGCAAIYTAMGGLKAVVWTDCFQIGMMFAGMLSIIIQGSINVGGLGKAFSIANDHGRIEFLNFQTDPFVRHTSFGLFFGQGVFWLSSYGTHQTTVQRYCSMDSLTKAFWALLCTAPLVSFTMSLAALCGVVIFANFAHCDPITLGFIKRNDQIAPYFVLEYLSPTSGLLGLFIACLYSGALSTVSSGLNSLAAVTWQDFCSRINHFKKMTEIQQGLVTKIIGFLYGALSIGMGFLAGNLGGVLSAALVVNGAVSGPLLGVFGAIIGMLLAHIVTLGIGVGGLLLKVHHASLPYAIDGCDNATLSRVSNFTEILLKHSMQNVTAPLHPTPSEIEWPMKIFTISYLLYPLIGTLITVIVGSLVSLCTGPTRLTEDQEKYTHPAIVYISKKIFPSESTKGNHHTQTQSLPRVELHHYNQNHNHLHQYNGYISPSQNEAYFGPVLRRDGHNHPASKEAYDNMAFQKF